MYIYIFIYIYIYVYTYNYIYTYMCIYNYQGSDTRHLMKGADIATDSQASTHVLY